LRALNQETSTNNYENDDSDNNSSMDIPEKYGKRCSTNEYENISKIILKNKSINQELFFKLLILLILNINR